MAEVKNTVAEPLWTKSFLTIMAVNFLMFSSMYLLLSTLPGYAVTIGGNEKTAGLIVGVFTISAVLLRPWFGNLLDWRGRKFVLLPGLFIFVLATLAFNWASVVWLLLVVRVIHGGGWAAMTTAASTIASDVIPAPRRGEGMGYYGISTTIAMSIGPALGLAIIVHYSYTTLFVIAAAMGLAAFLMGFFIKYKGVSGHGKTTGEKGQVIEKTAVPTALVMFFVSLSYGGIITFLPQYAKFRGIENIGLFFTVYALVLMVSRPITGRMADRVGAGTVLVPGLLFIMGALVSLIYATTLGAFLFSGLLYGIGFSAVQPVLSAITISLAPIQRRGAANATFFSSMDLGIGLGAIILGVFSQKFGYAAMYGISALFPVIALGLYFTFLKSRAAELEEAKNSF